MYYEMTSWARKAHNLPFLTEEDRTIFTSDTDTGRELRARMLKSLAKMLDIYGFEYDSRDEKDVRIVPAPNFEAKKGAWLNEDLSDFYARNPDPHVAQAGRPGEILSALLRGAESHLSAKPSHH